MLHICVVVPTLQLKSVVLNSTTKAARIAVVMPAIAALMATIAAMILAAVGTASVS